MSLRVERLKKLNSQIIHWGVNLLILLVAFWLRVSGLTNRSLWYDEAVEFMSANVPYGQLFEMITTVNFQPPLFTMLLYGWLKIGGEPVWLRLLPILVSMLTLVGVMKLGQLILGRTGGWLAGFIVATLPTEIYYAQDLGEYTLAVCTLTWSLFFLFLAQKRQDWRFWIAWGLFATLSTFSHYGMGIVVLSSALMVLVENIIRKRYSLVLRQSVVAVVFFIVGAPILWMFFSQQLSRIQASVDATLPVTSLIQEANRLLRGTHDTFTFLLYGLPLSQIPTWIGAALLLIFGLLIVRFYRQMPKRMILWFVFTFAIYFVLVRTGLYAGAFGLRYSQIFTPILIILMASAVLLLMRYVSRGLGLILLILSMTVALWAYPHPSPLFSTWTQSSWSPVEEMSLVFDHWWQRQQDNEVTYVYYGAGPAFRYYWWLNGSRAPTDSVEREPQTACLENFADDSCDAFNLYVGSWFRELPVVEKLARMEVQMGRWPQKMWLLFGHVHESEEDDIVQALSPNYEVTDSYQETGAAAYLLERTPLKGLASDSSISNRLSLRFGESIELLGYDVSAETGKPGDTLDVTLYWRALDLIPARYKVSVALKGQQTNPRDNTPLWGQQDNEPVNWSAPTNLWSPGDVFEDKYRITIDSNSPSDKYDLVTLMYGLHDGVRLPVYDDTGKPAGDMAYLLVIDVNR